jgi:hypothetical protein
VKTLRTAYIKSDIIRKFFRFQRLKCAYFVDGVDFRFLGMHLLTASSAALFGSLDTMMQRARALPELWRCRAPSLCRRAPLSTLPLPQEEPDPGKLLRLSFLRVFVVVPRSCCVFFRFEFWIFSVTGLEGDKLAGRMIVMSTEMEVFV